MEKSINSPSLWERFKGEYPLYLQVACIVIIAELIGTHKYKVGNALIVLYPMLFAIAISVILGRDLLGFFKDKQTKTASSLVSIAIAPFMAKAGILAGANIIKLSAMGPALAFQELGHIGTILFALPVAILLGLKREAIGATCSTNRDKDYGLMLTLYGPESPEARGSLSIYVIGFLVGTIYIGILASVVASLNIFHPLALGMASGIGSGVMMAAATSTLATIYPNFADQIVALGSASDTMAAVVGIYFTLFISLPITKKLYFWLEPRISPKHTRQNQQLGDLKISDTRGGK
jgi:hypothetical protein